MYHMVIQPCIGIIMFLTVFFFADMKLIEEEEFDFDIPDDYLNIRYVHLNS